MSIEPEGQSRLKFYGRNDYGTYFQLEQAAEYIEKYDPLSKTRTISEVLELHNVLLFAENGLFPPTYSDHQRELVQALIPSLRKSIARFFSVLKDTNLGDLIVGIDHEYRADLLELFSLYKVYDRCTAATVLRVFDGIGISLSELLTHRGLVLTYDETLRERLLSSAINAEILVRKYLMKDAQEGIHLPPSFTSHDARTLFEDYLNSDETHPNFVELISTARIKADIGIDARIKLKAKRKRDQWTLEFFQENEGIKTGCEISIVDDQPEPVVATLEGMVAKISYSRLWLEETLDYPSLLNNFIYLFNFADHRMMLTFPSFPSQLGVFERFLMTSGKHSYPSGAAFRSTEQITFGATVTYDRFLRAKGVELEAVIAWFFADYLKDEFEARNFRFVPSSPTSTYLEKSRHLFAEMESIVRQFALHVEDGEIDTELLSIASGGMTYDRLPSHVDGKYAYPSDNQNFRDILYLLFDDQSGLTYINDKLRAADAARLLINNEVAYCDFADHQQSKVDHLIEHGVLEVADELVRFSSPYQFIVLRDLFNTEAVNCRHYSAESRRFIEEMAAKNWLVLKSTLLSEPEASYFNFCLNDKEFSNGPGLRNRYQHGSHADSSDEDEHFRTFTIAVKLLIALVIKINDDFCLHLDEGEEK